MVHINRGGYQRLHTNIEINNKVGKVQRPPVRKLWLGICIAFGVILTMLYYYKFIWEYRIPFPETDDFHTDIIIAEKDNSSSSIDLTEPGYLVWSSKCKMVDLEPFNEEAVKYYKPEEYRSCSNLTLLTYVTKDETFSVVHVNKTLLPLYSNKEIICCYSNVTRPIETDSGVRFSACPMFENNVTFTHDPIMVQCVEAESKRSVYKNVHISITPTEEAQKKMDDFDKTKRPLSILLVGIDSISRLNLIRTMPKTYEFLEENNWMTLKGYNKVDDNTFPNLMAILTGYNQPYAYKVCDPNREGNLDNCSMIWYDYRDNGFITAYAEDEAPINTFNFLKKGFSHSPADYYFRPYVMASEAIQSNPHDTYCSGPVSAGERILNVAKDFSVTFKSFPTFGFFWMNSFSHDSLNSPSGMDYKVKEFLEGLVNEGVDEDTIIIFISDHGMRFGDIRLTLTGWFEERLPFIYVSFPKWFQEKFPTEISNFKNNSNKLTTPYDLHMTLKHILSLSDNDYNVMPSLACPACHSLLEPVDPNRSCHDVAIDAHWCTCTGYTDVALDTTVETAAGNFILMELDRIIRKSNGENLCKSYGVKEVLGTRLSQHLAHDNSTYLLMLIRTDPEAVFEATLKFEGDIKFANFSLTGLISRVDRYKNTSGCTDSVWLKKYCYCKDRVKRI